MDSSALIQHPNDDKKSHDESASFDDESFSSNQLSPSKNNQNVQPPEYSAPIINQPPSGASKYYNHDILAVFRRFTSELLM